MRIVLSIIFVVLIILLGVCLFLSLRSKKPIGKYLAMVLGALIFPVMGNLFIVSSIYETLSTVGCYIYFIGMNLVMLSMIHFTKEYCQFKDPKVLKVLRFVAYGILAADTISLLLNPFFHHAFTVQAIEAYGSTYYQFVPQIGQTIHRIIDYGILATIFITFIVKLITTPRVYAEKYWVIILAMLAVTAWQTFYIIYGNPVDFSMIGFGVFGLLIFVLSIYYRPLRLLDRMLASIASRMPEAIFFFDTSGKCIWVNEKARDLIGIEGEDFENISVFLKKEYGVPEKEEVEWTSTYTTGTGDMITSYEIEKHAILDDKNRVVGSYLSIHDNSKEQQQIERESYNAHHDALTKAYNRAGFDDIMDKIDVPHCFLVLLDFDSFKEINDKYGHNVGDQVIIRIIEIVSNHFREADLICRIGGDEFAIVIEGANSKTPHFVKERIDAINDEISKENELPLCTISSGGAFGKDAENAYELFNNADHALYETKFAGKRGFTLFKKR